MAWSKAVVTLHSDTDPDYNNLLSTITTMAFVAADTADRLVVVNKSSIADCIEGIDSTDPRT